MRKGFFYSYCLRMPTSENSLCDGGEVLKDVNRLIDII